MAFEGTPKEIWAIRNTNGSLVPPADDDSTDVFMAWPSEAEAKDGLQHQIDNYDLLDGGNKPEIVRLF